MPLWRNSFVDNCHCSLCRRHTGAAFAASGHAPRESFAYRSGADPIAAPARSLGRKLPVTAAGLRRLSAMGGKNAFWSHHVPRWRRAGEFLSGRVGRGVRSGARSPAELRERHGG